MRRAVFVLFFFLLVSCCKAQANPPPAPVQGASIDFGLVIRLQDSMAVLTEQDDGQNRIICAGAWLGVDTVLTAAHCVSDGPIGVSYMTEMADDGYASDWRPLDVVSVDVEKDLALVRLHYLTDVRPHGTTMVSQKGTLPGSAVYAVGCPLGWCGTVSMGTYVATRDMPLVGGEGGNEKIVHALIAIAPGSSGGFLADQDGNILGVCSFRFMSYPGGAFFIAREEILPFLHAAGV